MATSVAVVHPIEHLRFIARSSGADQRVLVHETASALRALGDDPAGLLVSCRRIIERHPTSGAMWWFAATVLASAEPRAACREAAAVVTDDLTPLVLADALPEGARVCVLGWPDLVGEALLSRGDVEVLAVDSLDHGSAFVRRLERSEVTAEVVDPGGLAAAVLSADAVLIEALAASPDEILAAPGSRAAASVAYCAEIPVWVVVGRGRVLPVVAFRSVVERVLDVRAPWVAEAEVVPLALATELVGHDGRRPAAGVSLVSECAAAPELLRPLR